MTTSPQRVQEELQQALFAQATESMLVADSEGTILDFNAASCQETGYRCQDLQQLTLDNLFPNQRPTPNIQFKAYELRQQDGRLIPISVETRLLGNGRFLLILYHPTEQTVARQKIAQLTETIQTINDLAIKLNGLLIAPNPIKQIATIIREIPGVFAASVSTYQPESKELLIREIATPASESGLLKRVNGLIGRSLIGMRIPVSSEMYQRMLREQVTAVGNLHEVTFGEIPKPISAIFHRTFQVDKLYGLALSEGEELIGTVVIVMRRDAEPLTQEVRLMLARICAITLRRARYEQQLQTSESKFRSYVEHAPVGIFVTDRNGRYLETNPAAARILGYTQAEIQNLTLKDIVHPDFLEASLQYLKKVRQIGHASGEFCLCTKQRQKIYTLIEAAALNDEQLIAFVQDITARKQAEENSKLKDELLHLTGEMGHIGGWELNPETLEGTWTDEIARIHDVDPTSPTNANFGLSFYEGEYRQKIEKAVQQLLEDGTPYDLELIITSARGKKKWIRTLGIPIWENGKIAKVRGIFQDISKSKAAEETLRQQIELQHQLSQIAATVPGMICAYKRAPDGHTSMPFTSAALAEIYGLPAEELAQDASPLFARIHPDDREKVQHAITVSAKTMQPWHNEYRYQHPQKGELWLEGLSVPRQEADGSMLWHGFIQDITERKKAEQEQALLEAQLRQVQKMDSIGRLAGGIAHDFNNLLTVIQMYTDLMDIQMAEADPLRPKLGQIKRASERATDLTRQLLAFSRKQIMSTVILDLNELITQLHKMLGRLIGEDITLTTALEPKLWSIQADPGQIEQVIMNLVVNARDAMPTGGMLTIETQNVFLDESFLTSQLKSPTGPTVMLAISDTGNGMDEATRQRIFEPFFTTKEAGNGTGLGLATVHGIVRQSGGSIFVYSEPNQGTTFKIYLPASNKEAPQTAQHLSTTFDNSGTETILVVEDEEAVRNLVCSTLEGLGYAVMAAKDGYAALSLMRQRNEAVDLLLTDVVMPKMSGRELAEQLVEQYSNLKVLFMSGYMDDAVVRHGILTAQVAFLPKPFSGNLLANKVREVLDEQTAVPPLHP
ncbi:MAG: PAS domain S-box protein [Anaerolineaceae bacterium]|nr:PAS domain S-box protein [Anaerolineaceae bacterium]